MPRATPQGADPSRRLSAAELRRLAERAANLDERLAAPVASHAADTATLEPWRRALSPVDPGALTRRLLWDGLDEARVAAALGATPLADPAWTSWLPRFVEESETCAELLASGRGLDEVPPAPAEDEPPFLELWVPMVRAARRAADAASAGAFGALGGDARRGLEAPLFRELSAVAELALLHRFHGCGLDYAGFVASMLRGGWAELFRELPVLARQLARLADTWAVNTANLLRRLREDHAAIAGRFGFAPERLASVAAGLSDRHHGGCRVAILTFDSGRRLVYKPRDVGLERAFQDLLRGLVEAGLRPAPPALDILERSGYGWCAFVERQPLATRAAAREFYARAGALLAVAHVLRARDLHNENVIATPAGPVLIDTEAALVHMDRAEGEGSATGGAPGRAAVRLADSCLATSLVALVNTDTLDEPFDIGGLRPSQGHMSSLPRRAWHGQRTDAIGFAPERRAERVTSGAPLLGAAPVAPEEHSEALLEGFGAAYRFLMRGRDDVARRLAAFAGGRRTRILFRASDQYAALLMVLFAPRHQRDGLERAMALEMLHRVFSRETERPRLWPLVAEERADLEGLDIPRFAVPVDDTAVVARGGERVLGHFVRSGTDAVRERLAGLSEDDLAAETSLLAAALQPSPPPPPCAAQGAERLVAAAATLGEAVIEAPAGLRRGPDALSLYDGSAGRALFLAALAAIAGGRWRALARTALRDLAAAQAVAASPGACTGHGSLVYTLVVAAHLLEDGDLLEAARAHAEALRPEGVQAETRCDVESGLAGGLLALLALHGATRDARLVEPARAFGARLLALQQPTGEGAAAWPSDDGRVHAGFAHGASGIALALGRLHGVAPDVRLPSAVRRALGHARLSYSAAERNWPLQRKAGGTLPMVAWCHGAPGIALARALLADGLLDAAAREDLDLALATTAEAPPGRFDHLCCGRLGRAEVLLAAGRRLGRASLVEAGLALAEAVAERVLASGRLGARTAGFEWRVTLPGFFEGLSGIGYALLRFAAPERLPCVLGFETGGDEA
jgi:lantibiotic modifying enzyme